MSGKEVIGAMAGTIAIVVVLAFFALPLMYPSINAEAPEDKGIVLQSLYEEFDSLAIIYDDNLTWQMVPDTELEISIEEDSRLSISFCAVGVFFLDISFVGTFQTLVSIFIEDVANHTFEISVYEGTALAASKNEYCQINFEHVTGELSEGDYTVQMMWKSTTARPGSNRFAFTGNSFKYPRSLLVEELAPN